MTGESFMQSGQSQAGGHPLPPRAGTGNRKRGKGKAWTEMIPMPGKWLGPSLTWLDTLLLLQGGRKPRDSSAGCSVTGFFPLSAGSSLTEARPDAPVSPADPVPRASETHPETLWQAAGLQQLPAAGSGGGVRLGQKGVWGPQRPACGGAPGVQPGRTQDSVELSVQFHHAPPGPDAGETAAVFHGGAGKHSTSTWPPRSGHLLETVSVQNSPVHSLHQCGACECLRVRVSACAVFHRKLLGKDSFLVWVCYDWDTCSSFWRFLFKCRPTFSYCRWHQCRSTCLMLCCSFSIHILPSLPMQ